jgi:membrane-bound lytic murein transglycosylase D
MFGKWYLAAMAYNCGEGRVKKAIREAKTDDINVLLSSKKRYIPKETKLYIRKIITMQSMANDPDFILENDSDYLLNQGSAETFSQVAVKQGTSLASIASSIGMSVKKLKAFNPQLRYYFVPPQKGKYIVYIPYDRQISFKKNYRPSVANNRYYVYTVKRGDSLYKISRKYKIKYRIIKDFNRLKSNRLRLGQTLVIPVLKPVTISYVIRKGDTIGRISRRFNVAVNDIMRANHKKNSIIRVGEKIVIPQYN